MRSFISQGPLSFHVNDTHAPAKASSELYSPRRCRRKIVVVVVVGVVVHVASALLGGTDEVCRREPRTSGIEKKKEEDDDDVVDVRSHWRRSCQPEMSDHGCIHLNNFKVAKGIQPYKVIHSYFVTSTSTEARVRKVRSCLFLSRAAFVVQGFLSRNFFTTFRLAPLCALPAPPSSSSLVCLLNSGFFLLAMYLIRPPPCSFPFHLNAKTVNLKCPQ